MTGGSAGGSRGHFWRIGRFVCGVAAVMGLLAAVPAVASAELSITNIALQGGIAGLPGGAGSSGCPSAAAACGPPGSLLRGGTSGTGTQSTVSVQRTSGTATTNPLGSIGYSYTGVSPTPDPPGPAQSGDAPGVNQRSGCVNTSNANGTGTGAGASNNVNPVLPRREGTYTMTFTLYRTAGCSTASAYATGVAMRTVAVAGVGAQPTAGLPCGGLKVALVLDESASIMNTVARPEAAQIRAAANGFVNALKGSGATVEIIAFAQRARVLVPYTEVTQEHIDTTFHPRINGTASGDFLNPPNTSAIPGNRQGTNWQGALAAVTGSPNLVLFVTDGDPNGTNSTATGAAGTTGSGGFSTSLDGGVQIMQQAVRDANALKTGGAHVFALGVGEALTAATREAKQSRLTAVSGPREFTTGESASRFEDSDWAAVSFAALEGELTRIVEDLCEGHLIVTKQVSNPDGTGFLEQGGWEITATMHSNGRHTWLEPTGFGDKDAAHRPTNGDGIAEFRWEFHGEKEHATLTVHETTKPGFELVASDCTVFSDGAPIQTGVSFREPMEVPHNGWVTCEAENQHAGAMLAVQKAVRPPEDRGRFNLYIGNTRVLTNVGNSPPSESLILPLGPHTVRETEGDNTSLADYDTSIVCVDLAANDKVVAGPSPVTHLTVNLTSHTENILCTFTNTSTKFGNLTVIKHVIPPADPGQFNLHVGGTLTREFANARNGDRLHLTNIPFGPYTVSETAGTNTTLAHYDISITCTNDEPGAGTTLVDDHSGPGPVTVNLNRAADNIVCVITNHRPDVPVAHLKVVKHLVPSGDAGLFDLLIGGKVWAPEVGDRGTTGRMEFELGGHQVTEHGAAGTRLADYSISTTCVDVAHGGHTVAHNAHGASVTVDLKHGQDIVCTITNKRAVTEPGGEITDPCLDFDPEGRPECGDVAAAPNLAINKRMPARARVGQLVTITITVKNLGRSTAHGVRVHEMPPSGGRIVHAANHGSIQHDGTAIWHLGSLAPGHSRTLRATMRVIRTGLHRNLAVATASNAAPAVSQAFVRARAAAHRPRPPAPPPPVVTG